MLSLLLSLLLLLLLLVDVAEEVRHGDDGELDHVPGLADESDHGLVAGRRHVLPVDLRRRNAI